MSGQRISIGHAEVEAHADFAAIEAQEGEKRHRHLFGEPKPIDLRLPTTARPAPKVTRTPSSRSGVAPPQPSARAGSPSPAPAASPAAAGAGGSAPSGGVPPHPRPADPDAPVSFVVDLPRNGHLDGWYDVPGVGVLLPSDDFEHVVNLLDAMDEHREGLPWDY